MAGLCVWIILMTSSQGTYLLELAAFSVVFGTLGRLHGLGLVDDSSGVARLTSHTVWVP